MSVVLIVIGAATISMIEAHTGCHCLSKCIMRYSTRSFGVTVLLWAVFRVYYLTPTLVWKSYKLNSDTRYFGVTDTAKRSISRLNDLTPSHFCLKNSTCITTHIFGQLSHCCTHIHHYRDPSRMSMFMYIVLRW